MKKKVLVVSALKLEIQPFITHARAVRSAVTPRYTLYQGSIGKSRVILGCLGVGPGFRKNIRSLDFDGIDMAILVGLCGGLRKKHRIGETAFPENIFSASTVNLDEVAHPSENLLYRMQSTRPAGNILCVNKPVTPQEKRSLSSSLDFVDMESYHFSERLRQLDIPFLIMKSVSDSLHTRLPDMSLMRSLGGSSYQSMLSQLVRHPVDFFAAVRLHNNMKRAVRANFESVMNVFRELEL